MYFHDSNRTIFIRDTLKVTSAFNRIEVLNASSDVALTNIAFQALGSVSKGTFVVTAGTVLLDGCTFSDMGVFSFTASTTATGCVFRRCTGIAMNGAGSLVGSTIATPTTPTSGGALDWDLATDPDGKLDDMTFSKGTNAHRAITFGTSSPTTMTLRGIAFSGFNASNGQSDSTLAIARTSGTVTINLVGCTGNISYVSAGATVVLVIDPVTLSVHVQDINTGSPITGARVWVPVTSSAGGKPYLSSVTSITRSGSTATVTMGAAHGLSTNDYVWIKGAAELEYNGTHQITVTGTTTFTYTVTGTPSTPATGTITATFVVISGTTDGSGDISASYSYSASQPVQGRVRTASGGGPYYKTAPITGTISNTAGLGVTVQMIPDS